MSVTLSVFVEMKCIINTNEYEFHVAQPGKKGSEESCLNGIHHLNDGGNCLFLYVMCVCVCFVKQRFNEERAEKKTRDEIWVIFGRVDEFVSI